MECSIGIDLGGTKILAGLVGADGNVLTRETSITPTNGSESILAEIVKLVHSLGNTARCQGIDVRGIGVGTAGQVDFVNGRVLAGTANINGWNNVSVRDFLMEQTGLCVWVDNDVNAFTLAETQLGSARGHKDAICIAFGTGVGGGVVINGNLLRGAWGGACELGHICVDFHGAPCKCGSRGCLETFASGTWLPIRMKEKLASTDLNVDNCVPLYPETSEEVFRRYQLGDACAIAVLDEMIEAVSFAMITFIHTFNPTMVVFGGGVIDHNPCLLSGVQNRLKGLGLRSLVDPVGLRLSHFGSNAGLIGAALQNFVYR